jgi:hypothetical protein
MRQELLEPIKDKARFEAAFNLLCEIFDLIDAGRDWAGPLARLNQLTAKNLSATAIEDVLELVEPEPFAYELTADPMAVPTDLTEAEMLELIEQYRTNEGDLVQLAYWMYCLEANTGDSRIGTLIHTPEVYFMDGKGPRTMSSREILDTALAAGRKKRAQAGG